MHSELIAHDLIKELKHLGIIQDHLDFVCKDNPMGLLASASNDELTNLVAKLRLMRPRDISTREHNHYFISVADLDTLDVYRLLRRFKITDPCLQHIIKKCLAPGSRGGAKDIKHDVQDIRDTANRWLEMYEEDKCTTR